MAGEIVSRFANQLGQELAAAEAQRTQRSSNPGSIGQLDPSSRNRSLIMGDVADNAEFFALLKQFINAWCDRRALRPLSRILGPYLAFNGLGDSWGEILNALKAVRMLCRNDISASELETVHALIRAAERALHKSLGHD